MWVKELLNEKQERTRRLSIVLLLLEPICSKRRSMVPGLRIGGLIAVRWRKPGRWLLNILNPLRARVHSTQQGALLQRCLIVEVRRFVGLVKEIRRTSPEAALRQIVRQPLSAITRSWRKPADLWGCVMTES